MSARHRRLLSSAPFGFSVRTRKSLERCVKYPKSSFRAQLKWVFRETMGRRNPPMPLEELCDKMRKSMPTRLVSPQGVLLNDDHRPQKIEADDLTRFIVYDEFAKSGTGSNYVLTRCLAYDEFAKSGTGSNFLHVYVQYDSLEAIKKYYEDLLEEHKERFEDLSWPRKAQILWFKWQKQLEAVELAIIKPALENLVKLNSCDSRIQAATRGLLRYVVDRESSKDSSDPIDSDDLAADEESSSSEDEDESDIEDSDDGLADISKSGREQDELITISDEESG